MYPGHGGLTYYNLGVSVQILHASSESYMCVGTYVEKDSKCDFATESRSISDINRTLDTYIMRCTRMIYKYHIATPPLNWSFIWRHPSLL
jgi:hypothetical protein